MAPKKTLIADILQPRVSWFFTGLVKSVRSRLSECDIASRLYIGKASCPEDAGALICDDFLAEVRADRVQGVISAATLPHHSWIDPLRAASAPLVGMSGGNPGFDARIYLDLQAMIEAAVEHLVGAGRQRLALLGWGDRKVPTAGDKECPVLSVFKRACRKCGAVSREDWVCADLHPGQAGAGWEEMREIWAAAAEKPDGLVVCDDLLFADAALAMVELGIRVPDELMVVTNANRGSATLYPFPVTRMEFDPFDVARAMVSEYERLAAGGERRSEPFEIGFTVNQQAAGTTPAKCLQETH